MRAYVLPRGDWGRLEGTELENTVPYLPADARVIVVEHDGAIVGTWSVLEYRHLEGLWIAEAHRRRGAVGVHLLALMRQECQQLGVRVALTAAATRDVEQLIENFGGKRLPGVHFALPVGG